MSGIFFGGKPLRILNEVVEGNIEAFVTNDIAEEYRETMVEMINLGKGTIHEEPLHSFISKVKLVLKKPKSRFVETQMTINS